MAHGQVQTIGVLSDNLTPWGKQQVDVTWEAMGLKAGSLRFVLRTLTVVAEQVRTRHFTTLMAAIISDLCANSL